MDKEKARDLLGDAKASQMLESLIEKFGPEPETVAKAHYDLQAAKAKLDQIKNEKEALEAKERKSYYKMKVKDMELLQRQSSVSESALQIKKSEIELANARDEVKRKKEEVEEMKDPLSIVKEEGEVIAAMDGKSLPLSKSGVTVVKIGHSEDKEQLEPKVAAPDPEKDPEFDGPADPKSQESHMDAKVVFAESMSEIFRILREDEGAPVGEVPAVQSQESEEKEEQKLPSEEPVESAEVKADAEPEILVTDTSIRIEIPVEKNEKPAEELGAEAGEAMVEALRVVYEILGGKKLNESEDGTVEVPADAQAEVKVEGDKIVVEIPVQKPTEEVSKEEGEALKEAALVLASVLKEAPVTDYHPDNEHGTTIIHGKTASDEQHLKNKVGTEGKKMPEAQAGKHTVPSGNYKYVTPEEAAKIKAKSRAEGIDTNEFTFDKTADGFNKSKFSPKLQEELGSAAAEPVHTDEKPVEHKPEVKQDEVHAGEQKAEEVKAPIIESKKLPEALKKNMFDDPKDADKVPEKLEKKVMKEEEEKSPEAAQPSAEEKPAQEPESSPEGSVVPSVEDTDTEQLPAEGEAVAEVKPAAEADVMVSDDKIRIEIPVENKEAEMPEMPEEKAEQVAESVRAILKVLSPKTLNEEESAEVSKNEAEAEIKIEDGKLVIEIDAESPRQEVSDEEALELSEHVSSLVESLMDEIDSEKISKDLEDKNELQKSEDLEKNEVDNSKREEGNKKAEELQAPIVEAAKPVHDPKEKAVEHKPEAKNSDIIKGQHAETLKAPIVESEEPAKPEHSVDQQYNVDAAIKVDMNPAKADEEHEIKLDKAEHKAEPENVTVKDEIKPGEEAEYRSLKEALLLEEGYFETPSVSTVTPEQKQQKLVGQIGLLVARESGDPLYEELLNAAALARELQSQLQEKYKSVAEKRAKQVVSSKSKKPEATQASALELMEYLDRLGSGDDLNEGMIDWVKGKFMMGVIKFLPESVIDKMIMKAHSKALSMVKGDEERKAVENEFSRYLKDKRDKVEFLKSLISKAPEDEKKKADQTLKAIASKISEKVSKDSSQGVPVNASYEQILLGVVDLMEAESDKEKRKEAAQRVAGSAAGGLAAGGISTAVNKLASGAAPVAVAAGAAPAISATQAAGYSAVDRAVAAASKPALSATQAAGYGQFDARSLAGSGGGEVNPLSWIGGLLKGGVQALTAFFATPLGSAIVGALVALAIAGVTVLVVKLVEKIRKGIEDPYGEVFGN